MSYRVFLSSTFTDLSDYRRAVQDRLRQLGVIDVSMEHFGARDERPVDECMRLIQRESDLFVGIYAHKYGYIPDGADISILETEYKVASEVPLPRFIYLIEENHPWPPTQVDDGASKERLLSFKAALLKRHIRQRFCGRDDLAAKVVADIGRHVAMQSATQVGPTTPVPDIGPQTFHAPHAKTPDEWNAIRDGIYRDHRRVFLTHVIRPSSKPGQTFDVFIYLIRHKSEDLSDIVLAEFFLGPYWQNKVFPAVLRKGFIGISTSAYGTFLCVCRVTFNDGHVAFLERYIDCESQRTGGAQA